MSELTGFQRAFATNKTRDDYGLPRHERKPISVHPGKAKKLKPVTREEDVA